jgi:hypothetical protein
MQQEVHHAQAVRIGHKLRADESVVPLEEGFLLRQFVEIVGAILDVAVGGDEEPSCARGRVLHSPACGFTSRTMQSIRGRGVKYCPSPDFLSEAFFSSSPS